MTKASLLLSKRTRRTRRTRPGLQLIQKIGRILTQVTREMNDNGDNFSSNFGGDIGEDMPRRLELDEEGVLEETAVSEVPMDADMANDEPNGGGDNQISYLAASSVPIHDNNKIQHGIEKIESKEGYSEISSQNKSRRYREQFT